MALAMLEFDFELGWDDIVGRLNGICVRVGEVGLQVLVSGEVIGVRNARRQCRQCAILNN